jgi:hypothetical protein
MAMDYFTQVKNRCDELDKLANAYLAKFEFLPNDQVMDRIHAVAFKIFKDANEDWDAVPEWVASCMDGWMPYTGYSNGSLHFALGFSVASQDAHLRNLMEIAEGRETKELDFPVVAEVPEIIEPETPVKKKRGKKNA